MNDEIKKCLENLEIAVSKNHSQANTIQEMNEVIRRQENHINALTLQHQGVERSLTEENELLRKEIDTLHQQIQEGVDFNQKNIDIIKELRERLELKVSKIEIVPGKLEAVLGDAPIMQIMAKTMIACLKSGPGNYQTAAIRSSDGNEVYSMTIQKEGAKTPCDRIKELEQEIVKLQELLKDGQMREEKLARSYLKLEEKLAEVTKDYDIRNRQYMDIMTTNEKLQWELEKTKPPTNIADLQHIIDQQMANYADLLKKFRGKDVEILDMKEEIKSIHRQLSNKTHQCDYYYSLLDKKDQEKAELQNQLEKIRFPKMAMPVRHCMPAVIKFKEPEGF